MNFAQRAAATTLLTMSAVCASAQSVTYGLSGASNITFELITQGFVSTDSTFLMSELTSCHSPFGECSKVQFFQDAFQSGLTETDGDLQAVSVSAGIVTSYFYFHQPALTTPGAHTELFGTNLLQVSAVPEASTLSMLSFGLMAISLAAWRSNRSAIRSEA